jgi:hypothetical protein
MATTTTSLESAATATPAKTEDWPSRPNSNAGLPEKAEEEAEKKADVTAKAKLTWEALSADIKALIIDEVRVIFAHLLQAEVCKEEVSG